MGAAVASHLLSHHGDRWGAVRHRWCPGDLVAAHRGRRRDASGACGQPDRPVVSDQHDDTHAQADRRTADRCGHGRRRRRGDHRGGADGGVRSRPVPRCAVLPGQQRPDRRGHARHRHRLRERPRPGRGRTGDPRRDPARRRGPRVQPPDAEPGLRLDGPGRARGGHAPQHVVEHHRGTAHRHRHVPDRDGGDVRAARPTRSASPHPPDSSLRQRVSASTRTRCT